jgi:hypothetical protein
MHESPKPKPPAKKVVDQVAPQAAPIATVKKPFVRKEHLTDRPLKNNPFLIELRDALKPTTNPKR